MEKIILKKGREKSLRNKHPWIFSGAVDKVEGNPRPGGTVYVYSYKNEFLGTGFYSPHSQIRIRIWSFEDELINNDFFKKKIELAKEFRNNLPGLDKVNAYRLINSESDGLPDLIVDKYDEFLVCQFLSIGAELWKAGIIDLLNQLFRPKGIYERSDSNSRQKEGLKYSKGILSGKEPPYLIEIFEDRVNYFVDIINGHKTGFYLDQRNNRTILNGSAKAKKILNCFSYTGGFGVVAAVEGAERVVNIDSSDDILELCGKNFNLNNISNKIYENKTGDVFKELRNYRNKGEKFDLIILDPPKFAENKSTLNKAARGYKDINMLAMQLLNNNGVLFTFSCSGLLHEGLFQKIVSDAALDAGIKATVIQKLQQAPDHRVILNFPESFYLKGLVVMKGDRL